MPQHTFSYVKYYEESKNAINIAFQNLMGNISL